MNTQAYPVLGRPGNITHTSQVTKTYLQGPNPRLYLVEWQKSMHHCMEQRPFQKLQEPTMEKVPFK